MEIGTERLKLRNIELSDISSIHELHSYAEVDEYNTLGIPKGLEETRRIVKSWMEDNQEKSSSKYTLAIEHRLNGTFLGLIGLNLGHPKYRRGEVWYKLHPAHWNNGYATESLKAIIRFGFDVLHLHRIEAGCAVGNIPSLRVLEKVGMVREGRRRKILPLKSGWSDNFEYSILETDKKA